MAKFKVGDRVVCKVDKFGNETVGKEYIVRLPENGKGWFQVERDDAGHHNSYFECNFELVEPTVKQPPPFRPRSASTLSMEEELSLLYSVREQVITLSKEVVRLKAVLDALKHPTIEKQDKMRGRPQVLPPSSKGRAGG